MGVPEKIKWRDKRGQEYWQQIVEVKMEGSKEVGNLLEVSFQKLSIPNHGPQRMGRLPMPMFFPLLKVEDVLISLVRSRVLIRPHLLMEKSF